MTPHGMMSWFDAIVWNDCSVARAVVVTVTDEIPNTLVKKVGAARVAVTVTLSFVARSDVFAYVAESPAASFFPNSLAAAGWAIPQPLASWDAPANAAASAAACRLCFECSQLPTSIAPPAIPITENMNTTTSGSVCPRQRWIPSIRASPRTAAGQTRSRAPLTVIDPLRSAAYPRTGHLRAGIGVDPALLTPRCFRGGPRGGSEDERRRGRRLRRSSARGDPVGAVGRAFA